MAEKFTREELNTILRDYISRLEGKIKLDKVILYGSYAKGTATRDSDIDVLVISSGLSINKPKGANGLYLDRLVGLSNVNPYLEVIGVHPDKLSNPITKSFFDEVLETGLQVA